MARFAQIMLVVALLLAPLLSSLFTDMAIARESKRGGGASESLLRRMK